MSETSSTHGDMEEEAETSKRVRVMKMVGVCPHCGETVTVILTKPELKEMLKGMKMPIHDANLLLEQQVKVRMGKIV